MGGWCSVDTEFLFQLIKILEMDSDDRRTTV